MVALNPGIEASKIKYITPIPTSLPAQQVNVTFDPSKPYIHPPQLETIAWMSKEVWKKVRK